VASAALVQAARAAGLSSRSETGGRNATKLWASVLAEIPLFAHVPARNIRRIAGVGTVVRFEAGSEIVRAGQASDSFYVVLDGKGSVIRPRKLPPAPIRTGAYFGEMALIDGQPRSATVVASTEMTCLRLGRAAFAKILRSEPSVSAALLRVLAGRVRDLQAAATD
jgi:CRP/FNR family cyclic AMP-dependent transcriptional regulator